MTLSGSFALFPLPCCNLDPTVITQGPDGALWYSLADNAIGRITTSGDETQYPISSQPYLGIATGPDGALWFAECDSNLIGRLTTAGGLTEYLVPTPKSCPGGITAGPDGALWFTEGTGNNIGRITTAGAITNEYPLGRFRNPLSITAGPDGALWFTEGNGIAGRITTSGAFTQYNTRATLFGAGGNITSGPDGALWFTAPTSNEVGRVTTDGAITMYEMPASDSQPTGIASGPDGDIWFTEFYNNNQGHAQGDKIGRIPACGLGLTASFTAGTLTVKAEPGINRPAIWTLSAGAGYGFTKRVAGIVPPRPFTFTYRNYPNVGKLRITSKLSDNAGRLLCSEYTTVNTASK